MNTWMLVVGSIVLVIMLFAARGAYLLGRGTEAEQVARSRSSGEVESSGWMLLDWLQEGDIGFVSGLEEWLGINQDDTEEEEP